MNYAAFKFASDEDLRRAINHLRLDVAPKLKLEYDIVRGSAVLVVPLHLQPYVRSIVNDVGLKAEEIKTAPFGDLEMKERHDRRRSLLSKRTA